ncbi:MAG: DNA polymerase III subunit alpha, partial [Muribaculaceae bacterium]|nr:DNA polymerase III subunit alpha [Muribaculaceae bacterium]
MSKFVHLHVHTQYSILDGQASVSALVDKAMADGMPAIAVTDHGNMFGIKEFFNYVAKKNSKTKGAIKDAEAAAKEAEAAGNTSLADEKKAEAESLRQKIFKPILGCEVYVAEESLLTHVDKHDTGRHLILLAKNEKGYHNLVKIVSRAWTEGFYSHPRTDKADIEAHKEGLIVCSACLGGEIPRLISAGRIEEAEERVKWWKERFGDDYYLELQRHKATVPRANHETYPLQERVNKELIRIARKFDVKLICTNDVHFVNEDDAEAHERLICLSTNKKISDENRMLYSKQEWLKTTAEMSEVFADLPESLSNTLEIADKVEFYEIDHAPIMPFFAIPEEFGTEEEYRSRITTQELFDEFTRDENGNVVLSQEEAEKKISKLGGYDKLYRIKFEADYLKKLAYEGAERRYGTPLSPELEERIKFELHIMKTMGFPGYFLIVQDFINVSRETLGVSVGPGRGSAAGSCVAYCLGITQIDPIKYDLLFERFLNPDRISLPDIDVDFDDDGRARVLQYVTEKYGADNVAHIITYGTMATKMALKDVARVEGLPIPESDRLVKLLPRHMPEVNGKEAKMNLTNCLKLVPEFKAEQQNPNPLIRETLKYAEKLEGNVRGTGVHACGVIICRDKISDWVPVSTAVDKLEGKLLVTQYEGRVIEETGLIKMDFLGLKTLSIIMDAVRNIKLTRGIDIDMEKIPIDDPLTYQLYCEGRTIGTFQFESAGMQKYLRELQPSTFEDLIAMNALYRPGPMDYI